MCRNFKWMLYCGTRNFVWTLVYSGVIGLMLWIMMFVLYGSEYVSELGNELFKLNPFDVKTSKGISAGAVSLFVLSAVVISYFITKKILDKVFFKPYKWFKLEPAITRISAKMVWVYLILFSLLGILDLLLDYYIRSGYIVIIKWIALYIETVIITFYLVLKYARIIEK